MSESRYTFAEFQVNCASFELRRQGRAQKSERISLERIPMELLILLLERQGSVVTRQEIVDRLWGKDVFVDTEHGINTAIRKVRQALKDDPDNPRFIHTVSGKGYRFIAEKNGRPETPELVEGRTPGTSSGPDSSGRGLTTRDTAAPSRALTKRKTALAIAAISLLAATLLVVLRSRLIPGTQTSQIHSLAVMPLSNLSGDPSQDYFADGMTDELITALAKNRTLRVVSRTSAMQYTRSQSSCARHRPRT